MEGMNGVEVCRVLRGMPGTEKIPIVIFSTQDIKFSNGETLEGVKTIKYSQIKDFIKKIEG
ncbi:MAG: hypothetical protein ABIH08_02420 [Candidatus Omnitrophota bacterium]